MSVEKNKARFAEEKPGKDANSTLQGWPGYRTRAGRSGLDPLDSRAEAGHTAGVLIHRLLTGNFRTKNPISLFLLAIGGLLLTLPFFMAILGTLRGDFFSLSAWLVLAFACLLGVALLVNLIRNLAYIIQK
jgi:hypothetical protein